MQCVGNSCERISVNQIFVALSYHKTEMRCPIRRGRWQATKSYSSLASANVKPYQLPWATTTRTLELKGIRLYTSRQRKNNTNNTNTNNNNSNNNNDNSNNISWVWQIIILFTWTVPSLTCAVIYFQKFTSIMLLSFLKRLSNSLWMQCCRFHIS